MAQHRYLWNQYEGRRPREVVVCVIQRIICCREPLLMITIPKAEEIPSVSQGSCWGRSGLIFFWTEHFSYGYHRKSMKPQPCTQSPCTAEHALGKTREGIAGHFPQLKWNLDGAGIWGWKIPAVFCFSDLWQIGFLFFHGEEVLHKKVCLLFVFHLCRLLLS